MLMEKTLQRVAQAPERRTWAMRADSRVARGRARAFHRAMKDAVAELMEPGALQRMLERRAQSGAVDVALVGGSAPVTATLGVTRERAAPLGCIAKVLTAALVSKAAEAGRLAFDASIAELLGGEARALRGVTVRHLLEHTHGLDDSLLAAPRRLRGCIDNRELLARVGALVRWAPAGAAYSYGNLGAWLLAALLERVRGAAFGALVRDELLAPLGIQGSWARGDSPEVCAATGAGLALTVEELARFALHAADNAALAAAPVTPLPGWHPLECGVCLGWKCAGDGWLGHQSAWPGASCYLRVHATRKLALVVFAGAQAASLVALGLLGSHFPELFDGRKRLRLHGGSADDEACGAYSQAARVVTIAAAGRGLCADAWERDEHGARSGRAAHASLTRIGNVLFAQPASELMPYLELVSAAQGSAWLWNGRFVFRRVD
jgi:CubicO group peptidase (beta-lactamase class C family)